MKVRMNCIETKQQETLQKVQTVEAIQVTADSGLDKVEARQ